MDVEFKEPIVGLSTKYIKSIRDTDLYGRKIKPVPIIRIIQGENLIQLEESQVHKIYSWFEKGGEW